MKILHIIPSYLPAKLASGPIIPTHNLNKELIKRGVEVVVYTANLDGQEILNVPLNQEVNIDGVKVFYFPITFKPWQYSFGLHRALAKNIKDFDLIHITSVFLSASALGAYYAKKFKKPYIISPHGSLMSDPLSRHSLKKKIYLNLIEKKNLKNAAAIHFLINREKEDYLKAGLLLKKTIVIPNCFYLEESREISPNGLFRKKFGIGDNKKIVLFLARLHPIKGLDTLIPAFAEVIKKESRAVLVLAGPDENGYKKEIIKMINDYNLTFFDFSLHQSALSPRRPASCIFTGMLIGEKKVAAFRESNVFVLPSYTEALPMATIEAMYFGLPVVITEGVGISPNIDRAEAGLVINKDEKQLVEAILKILENPRLGKEMGQKGRELVETEFSSEKVAGKWIEEYNKIIKNYKKDE